METETKSDSSHQMTAQLPPPPNKTNFRPIRQWNNQFVNNEDFTSRLFITSPPNHITSISINNNNNINLIVNDEPEKLNSRSSSANEFNSSPTDSVDNDYTYGEKSWSEFHEKEKDKPINWADFDEGHHLLENEEIDDDEEDCDDKNSYKSSSSDDDSHDIWNISEEQRNYYINQFKTMQMNLNGKITGNTAKEFFEKSALPIHELSRIWQLSDIDKDGALTLDEFCVAMHLVVLRRNNIDLPDKLPLTLVSAIDNQISNHNSSKNTDIPIIPNIPSNEPINSVCIESPNCIDLNEVVIKDKQEVDTLSPQNKEWTKFSDSPTSNIAVTAISSPPSTSSSASGMQTLANFDFNAALIVKDPKILHPVALRVSPDGQPIKYNISETNHDLGSISPLVSTFENVRMTTVVNSLSHPYVNTNTITNNSGKKDPPPPPPPRPIKVHGHTRSSSLDLNQLNSRSSLTSDVSSVQNPNLKVSNSEYGLIAPLKEQSVPISLKSRHFGAFVAYKKDKEEKLDSSLFSNAKSDALRIKFKLPTEVPLPKNLSDNLELLETIEALREYNKSLVEINTAILEELVEVTESRNKLESQLAKLNGCKF